MMIFTKFLILRRPRSGRFEECTALTRGVTKSVRSSRTLGDEGPELVGAVCGDHAPEALSPHRLVAELLAPRPEPPRRMMQRMLVGEAHRPMHLMGDRRPGASRLAAAHLGDRHLREADFRPGAGLGRGVSRRACGGDFTRQ